jgi:hypothetical protein
MRRFAAAILLLLLTTGCLGPKPVVRSAEVAPPKDGKAEVTVLIVNTGGGDGQVELKITLRQGGDVVGRADEKAELKPRETITIVLEVSVPADATNLTVDAEVVYPPD